MKRVNIGIDEYTHKHAKIISVLKNVGLNDYLKTAIETAVEKDKQIIKILNLQDQIPKPRNGMRRNEI